MSLKRTITLLALLAVMSISAIWLFVIDREQDLLEETAHVEVCDSCTARHQNLLRLRDAHSSAPKTDE